jgi:micrococcal nuclease
MKYRKIATVFVVFLVCIIIFYYYTHNSYTVNIDEQKYYPVTYVVDGDTFKVKVDKQTVTIRLLGINTPETVDPRKPIECFGKEASDETKNLLMGHFVQLRFNPARETQDRYHRYLAYVYVDSGVFLNEYLIMNGYAREYTYGTAYTMQGKFRDDQRLAKVEGRGLWGRCGK